MMDGKLTDWIKNNVIEKRYKSGRKAVEKRYLNGRKAVVSGSLVNKYSIKIFKQNRHDQKGMAS